MTQTERFLATARTRWRGAWLDTNTPYEKYDQVTDAGYLGVANKRTTDRLAPEKIGDPEWLFPDAMVWSDTGNSTNLVSSGLFISNITDIFDISKARVWVQNITANDRYRLMIRDVVTGDTRPGEQFLGTVLTSPGWYEVALPQDAFLVPGDQVEIYLEQINTSATTTFQGDWDYRISNQAEVALAGEAHERSNRATLAINKTDQAAVDRGAELLGVTPGSTVEAGGRTWSVNNTTDLVTEVVYDISASAIPLSAGVHTFTFTIPTPQPTVYVFDNNYWVGNEPPGATVVGILRIGTGAFTPSVNGYGVDIFSQELNPSPDWDIQAIPSGTSGVILNPAAGGPTNATIWQGQWDAGNTPYDARDQVTDDGWLMIANTPTVDRAAPQPLGSADWILPDAMVWTSTDSAADTILSGIRLTNVQGFFTANTVRVWLPQITPQDEYRVIYTDLISGDISAGGRFLGDVLAAPGWYDAPLPSRVVLQPGDEVEITLEAINAATDTIFTGRWTYSSTAGADQIPAPGRVFERTGEYLRFNDIDADAVNQRANLLSVTPGSTIEMTANGRTWIVDAVVPATDYVQYDHSEFHGPFPTTYEFLFTIPTATDTAWVVADDWWLTNLEPLIDINGVLQIGAAAPAVNDNAYGVDLFARTFNPSPDWDFQSYASHTFVAMPTTVLVDQHSRDISELFNLIGNATPMFESIPANKRELKRLRNGNNNPAMDVNASSVDINFDYDATEETHIWSLNFSLDGGDPNDFGSIPKLTKGCLLRVVDGANNVVLDLLDGGSINRSRDFDLLGKARVDVGKRIFPLILEAGQTLRFTIRDDLSALDKFQAMVDARTL